MDAAQTSSHIHSPTYKQTSMFGPWPCGTDPHWTRLTQFESLCHFLLSGPLSRGFCLLAHTVIMDMDVSLQHNKLIEAPLVQVLCGPTTCPSRGLSLIAGDSKDLSVVGRDATTTPPGMTRGTLVISHCSSSFLIMGNLRIGSRCP